MEGSTSAKGSETTAAPKQIRQTARNLSGTALTDVFQAAFKNAAHRTASITPRLMRRLIG